ncbi:MAG: NADH-quinone oxidoreductase subunit L [Candidatus Melainabacteria bacterium HGW-Melainabacteria-1]|nr:MAG: NADH-quinone oxidoreductase subunit L [Candidatus Melainabacteria bacterium HGW-Melainabacteria-1]
MMQTSFLLSLIVLLPLLGALCLGGLALARARHETGPSEKLVGLIGCLGPALAAGLALYLMSAQLIQPQLVWQHTLAPWLQGSQIDISFAFAMDHLAALMTVMITFIGSLIHLFSIGYMQGDRGFTRYFAYLNLFLASMLMLVLSDNIVLLFMGWEGVGVCSYLLIGFWFTDAAKAAAGTKAFVVNRIGDFGFILGIFFLFWETNSFSFSGIAAGLEFADPNRLAVIGLLLLIGALGKSAQIPLHVWLPDAMAGPTPVSALIHAATMVTAGVYMIARLSFLYDRIPAIGLMIVVIGGLTALMAASIALVQTDIKKVLAYSTVSQLGYMFMAVGAGAYAAGIFHVFTHAFFKAALFLGAGAVIHCLHHEQDMLKMGGLRAKLPITHAVMLISCIAIAGIPPFAGFFSKDEILWSLWNKGLYLFWGVGLLTAGLTAFYMFRLYFLTFGGSYRGHHEVAKEPLLMKLPLMVLALGAIGAGWLGLPAVLGLPNWIEHWLEPVFGSHHGSGSAATALMLMGVSVMVAAGGILYARSRYSQVSEALPAPTGPIADLLHDKWGFDLLYDLALVRPLRRLGVLSWQIGDKLLIDGPVRFATWGYLVGALCLRQLQTGKVRIYAHYLLLGMFLLVWLFFMLHMPGVFL